MFAFLLCCFCVHCCPYFVEAPPAPSDSSHWASWSSCWLLVPPSRYLLLLATAWLPCLCAWGVVVLCFPSSLCLVAAKAFGPVWGFIPLHHVACAAGVLCAPSLRYSSAYDPAPCGTPLRHSCIPSGTFVSFLCLSSAASWLLSFSLLWCFRVCVRVFLPCPAMLPPCTGLFGLLVRLSLRIPKCYLLRCATKIAMCRLAVTKDLPALRWLLAASCPLLT